MALNSTVYNIVVELSDIDRGVYESLDLRVAQHPSESAEYMVTRVLAYCLEYTEGIEFTQGLSNADEPAIVVRDLVCEDTPEDYTLRFRVYGVDGVRMNVPPNEAMPGQVFIMAECIAPTRERASEVVRTCKQFLLHYCYPRRPATAGNIAFPFTPPEISVGPAYRFTVYHLLHVDDVAAPSPFEVETL